MAQATSPGRNETSKHLANADLLSVSEARHLDPAKPVLPTT